MVKGAEEDDDEESSAELIGTRVRTKSGRTGKIVAFDPNDRLLEIKVEFDNDGQLPYYDWMSGDDVDSAEVLEDARLPQSTRDQSFTIAGPSTSEGNIELAVAGGIGGHEPLANSIPAEALTPRGEDGHEDEGPGV